MLVFLQRIPPDTARHDIVEFLDPVLKGGLFLRKGIVEKIEIMILRDSEDKFLECHGLVRIEPEAAAQRVIKKLNRKPINGKHIAVREFHLRNWHNDPRLRKSRIKIHLKDKRKKDRRRPDLKLEEKEAPISITGEKKFHRIFTV